MHQQPFLPEASNRTVAVVQIKIILQNESWRDVVLDLDQNQRPFLNSELSRGAGRTGGPGRSGYWNSSFWSSHLQQPRLI